MRIFIKSGSLLSKMHPELTAMERLIGINVDGHQLDKFIIEAKTSVPHLSTEEQYVWAVVNAHKHPGFVNGQPEAKKVDPKQPIKWDIILLSIIILLLLLLISGVKLHAQGIAGATKKVKAIPSAAQFKDNSPITVIPLADADKISLLKLIRQQDKLIIDRKDSQLKISDLDKQISDIQLSIQQLANDLAIRNKIDVSNLILDEDKLAWITRSKEPVK